MPELALAAPVTWSDVNYRCLDSSDFSFSEGQKLRTGVDSAGRLPGEMERMTGIEPAYSAWEADVLPLNYIRKNPQTSAVNVEARSASTVRPPAELSRCGAVHCVGGVSLQRSVCLIAAASATD